MISHCFIVRYQIMTNLFVPDSPSCNLFQYEHSRGGVQLSVAPHTPGHAPPTAALHQTKKTAELPTLQLLREAPSFNFGLINVPG